MTFTRLTLAAAIAAAATSAVAEVKLTTDAQKLGYTIGADMGRSVTEIDKDGKHVDFNALIVGLKAAYDGKELALTPEEMDATMQKFAEERLAGMQEEMNKAARENAAAGEKYLEENKGKEGIKTTASGLQYKVEKEGDGEKPKAADTVKVHYTGKLIDGTVFDSSVERGEPVTFKVQEVIPGWIEGLQLMKTGGKYTFYIPSKLGYGEFGAGPTIPPNSVLVFDVELLEIVKEEAGGEKPANPGSEISQALQAAEKEVKEVVQPADGKTEGKAAEEKPAAEKPAADKPAG